MILSYTRGLKARITVQGIFGHPSTVFVWEIVMRSSYGEGEGLMWFGGEVQQLKALAEGCGGQRPLPP